MKIRKHLSRLALVVGVLVTWGVRAPQGQVATEPTTIQFVFTSDAHYGITRDTFRGHTNVDAHTVNAAMIAKINGLSSATFPKDGGLKAGEQIGAVEFLAQGGDIANREEVTEMGTIQSAARSWTQFQADYLEGVHLAGRSGARAPVYMVPGNHDVSNAIGYHLPMVPTTDNTSMVEIFNYMMHPAVARTSATYHYPEDKILVSHDIGGMHFMFITMWPDSSVRAWMERDLANVAPTTPVFIVTHDQPESQAKHFSNPNGAHDINGRDKFENLLAETLADGPSAEGPTTVEQRSLEGFLAQHPNITAYFHGNSNWNQFYDWTGPGNSVVLHTFRVDSPMKGAVSATDETKLSFQVITLDAASRRMTVRECLWNSDPQHPSGPLAWGSSTTVAFAPRPDIRNQH